MATVTLPTGFGNGDAVAASLDRSPLALRSPTPSPPTGDLHAEREAGGATAESPDEVGESPSSSSSSFVDDDDELGMEGSGAGGEEGPPAAAPHHHHHHHPSGEPARDAVSPATPDPTTSTVSDGEGVGPHDDGGGRSKTKTDADGAMIPSPRDVGAADSLLAAPLAMAKPSAATATGEAVQVVMEGPHRRSSADEEVPSLPVPHQPLLDHPPQRQGSIDAELPLDLRKQNVKGLLQQQLQLQMQQQHQQQQATEQEVNPLLQPLQRQRSNVSSSNQNHSGTTPLSSIGENNANMIMSGITPPANLGLGPGGGGPPASSASTTFGGRGSLNRNPSSASSRSSSGSGSGSHDDDDPSGGTGDESSYTNTNSNINNQQLGGGGGGVTHTNTHTHTRHPSGGGGGKVYSAVFGSMEQGSFNYRHMHPPLNTGGRFQSPPHDGSGGGRRYPVQSHRAIADGKQENSDPRQPEDSVPRRDQQLPQDHGERMTRGDGAEAQAGGKVPASAQRPASALRSSKTAQHPPRGDSSSSIVPSDPRAEKSKDGRQVKMQDPLPPTSALAAALPGAADDAKARGGAETFRPSSDAYTPRLKKAPTFKPAPERESVSTHSMGTISRPNFRDALRRVAMIIRRHIVKIERRFTDGAGGAGAGVGADAGPGGDAAPAAAAVQQLRQPHHHPPTSDLFLPSMRDAFHEDRFVTPRYRCTTLRVPGLPCGGFLCPKRKIAATYGTPTESEIYDFARKLFGAVQLSSECSIVCLIYVERLMEVARVPLLGTTWRPIFMAGLLLASKVWQDLSSWNIEFATVYPQYGLEAINRLELLFLRNVKWDLYISGSLYAKYYFALRALCEKQDFRHRYNRMVGGVGQVSPTQALKIQHRTEKVKDDALLQLSRSM